MWPGLPWNPTKTDPTTGIITNYITFPWNGSQLLTKILMNAITGEQRQWYIEEAVIRGGFNNTRASLGVRAYLAEDDDANATA